MELIIIDECRLKIMLTPTDMRHYDLRSDRMSTAGAVTRRAFRHIFDDARERIGFDTAGERLFVQLYTCRTGGCEIFVTKLGAGEDGQDADGGFAETDIEELRALDDPPEGEFEPRDNSSTSAERTDDGTEALLNRLRKEGHMEHPAARSARTIDSYEPPEIAVYRLNEAETLFSLCRRLAAVGYAGESAVYIDAEGAWYLFLTPALGERVPPFLAEYAARLEDAATLGLWLSEHGRAVCAGEAVEILSRV